MATATSDGPASATDAGARIAPAVVRLADYLQGSAERLQCGYIVAVQWASTYGIEFVDPRAPGSRYLIDKGIILEPVPPSTSESDRERRLLAYKVLAALSGLQVRSRGTSGNETRSLLARARLDDSLRQAAADLQSTWPFTVPAGALESSAARLSPASKSSAQIDDGDGPALGQPVDAGWTYPEGGASRAQLVPAATCAGNVWMGDRLEPAQHRVMLEGLYPPRFRRVEHERRRGAPFAVMLLVPMNPPAAAGHDVLICTVTQVSKMRGAGAYPLYVGTSTQDLACAGEIVRMWRAIASCFGVRAVTRSGQAAEPFTHPRTQFVLKHRPADAIFEAINNWPLVGHESLKPLAQARAQAVIGGAGRGSSPSAVACQNAGPDAVQEALKATAAACEVLQQKIEASRRDIAEAEQTIVQLQSKIEDGKRELAVDLNTLARFRGLLDGQQ